MEQYMTAVETLGCRIFFGLFVAKIALFSYVLHVFLGGIQAKIALFPYVLHVFWGGIQAKSLANLRIEPDILAVNAACKRVIFERRQEQISALENSGLSS